MLKDAIIAAELAITSAQGAHKALCERAVYAIEIPDLENKTAIIDGVSYTVYRYKRSASLAHGNVIGRVQVMCVLQKPTKAGVRFIEKAKERWDAGSVTYRDYSFKVSPVVNLEYTLTLDNIGRRFIPDLQA